MFDNLLGKQPLIGLDIGQSAIKLATLGKGKKGTYTLKSFSFAPLSESAILEEEINDRTQIIEQIRSAFKEGGFKNKDVCFGLAGSGSIVKSMKSPEGSKDDIENHIHWEAEQFIPFGMENAEVSLHIMPKDNELNRDVVMAAAKIQDIARYQEIIFSSGLKMKTVDLQVLSLINIFEHNYSDYLHEYKDGTLIIDFGAQSTKVIVYRNGLPILVKTIIMGGVNSTEEIQKEVGIDFNQAEDLKKMNQTETKYPDEVLAAIKKVSKSIISKVVDAVAFYTSANSEDRIKHCFITGGCSRQPGIIEDLIEELDISVETLDPLRKISVSSKGNISDGIIDYLTYSGAVCLGLGLRAYD